MTEPPADPTEPRSDSFAWLQPAPRTQTGSAATGGAPISAYNQTYPSQTYGRSYPAEVYPPQPSDDAPWPLVSGEPPRARRRPSLVLGLVIALVVVLAGGATAAFLLIGPASSRGSASPAAAVDGFLDGIYGKHSSKDAARFVCARARNDQELDQIVFAVKTYEQEFTSARTTWTYPDIHPAAGQATAEVTLTMTTANEQVAEKQITLLLVDDRGWWVCDVQTAE